MKIVKHKIIQTLHERDGDRCALCGKTLPWKEYLAWRKEIGQEKPKIRTLKRTAIDIDVDHKIQRRKLKGNKWIYLCNLQLTHKKCNNLKG